jgi:signal transduction histidine kinase
MREKKPKFPRTRAFFTWLYRFLFRPLRWSGRLLLKVRSSLRLQLIGMFVVCILAGLMVSTLSSSVFGKFNQQAYLDYESSMQQIDRDARYLASVFRENKHDMNREQVQNLLDKNDRDGEIKIMIVDLDGKVLFKSSRVAETQIDLDTVIRQVMERRTNSESWKEGTEYVSFYPTDVLGQKTYLVVSGNPKPSIGYRYETSPLWGMLGIATFFLTFYYLTRRKMNYIEDLAGGLLKISEGRLGHRVPQRSQDELGSLAQNINHMAEELQKRIEEERRVEQVKNELITNVSHDLRTPLTSIMGYLRLLNERRFETEEQAAEYLRVAFSKSEQLQGLVNDLFEYTKLSSPGLNMHRTDVRLDDLLGQLVEEYVPICEEAGLTLRPELPPQHVVRRVDPDLLVRVLDNLLGNAVKYSRRPGEIVVSLTEDDEGALIAVQNQGDAIAQADLTRLFERFYRVDAARSSATGGSGLGLAIAKSIVEHHGGEIWAESEGELVTFYVRLPAAPQD